jgi:hypothetical protein
MGSGSSFGDDAFVDGDERCVPIRWHWSDRGMGLKRRELVESSLVLGGSAGLALGYEPALAVTPRRERMTITGHSSQGPAPDCSNRSSNHSCRLECRYIGLRRVRKVGLR